MELTVDGARAQLVTSAVRQAAKSGKKSEPNAAANAPKADGDAIPMRADYGAAAGVPSNSACR